MKKLVSFFTGFILVCMCPSLHAQDQDANPRPRWDQNLQGYFYFMQDDFFFLPIYQADTGHLHLEARYNYEDMQTFSAWIGYNFNGGNKFSFEITPMIGGVIGHTSGMATGVECTLNYAGFEFYTESEYVFDLEEHEDDFYYNWTDFTYSPLDWLWFGLSTQRTKLYQTDLEIQRGLLLGGGYRWFGLTGYLYNLGWDDPYFILAISVTFPDE